VKRGEARCLGGGGESTNGSGAIEYIPQTAPRQGPCLGTHFKDVFNLFINRSLKAKKYGLTQEY